MACTTDAKKNTTHDSQDGSIVSFLESIYEMAGFSWTYDMEDDEREAILAQQFLSNELKHFLNTLEGATCDFGEAIWNRELTQNEIQETGEEEDED